MKRKLRDIFLDLTDIFSHNTLGITLIFLLIIQGWMSALKRII